MTVVAALAPASLVSAEAVTQASEYTVVQGDYLDKIAKDFGTTWQKLFSKNTDIAQADLIYTGQKLVIPSKDEPVPERSIVAPEAPQAPESTPAPAEAPAPVVQPVHAEGTGGADCGLARSLINQYDWNTDVAYQVMVAESNCNPQAANWNDGHETCMGSFGLFQINCTHGQLYDAAANVAAAYDMYKASGWQPWGFTTCAVKVSCY